MTGAAHIAYAAAAEALKASGTIVRVEPAVFVSLLGRSDQPLVIVTHGGVFRKRFKYLTSYKGLAFYTESATKLSLPRAEIIQARSISVPEV
jgi:hypothetical protein